jgi:hypothetical protein
MDRKRRAKICPSAVGKRPIGQAFCAEVSAHTLGVLDVQFWPNVESSGWQRLLKSQMDKSLLL